MIRAYKDTDIDTLVDIWYKGLLQAHDFIDTEYEHNGAGKELLNFEKTKK